MILFKKAAALSGYLKKQRETGMQTGFVPTMGALHQGHISLIEQAAKENELTVCSIFVNPTQFNDPEDFAKYPVTIEKDIVLLEKAGCSVLFLPSVAEIYPSGTSVREQYDLGYLEQVLEGKYRPGHFQGVCAVVHRLLSIAAPDNLYIGQKDYQQCMVITRLAALTGFDNMNIHIAPTLREKNGLAMSSRNRRLSGESRDKATGIYQSLSRIKNNIRPGNVIPHKQAAIDFLTRQGFKVDYVEIADAATLEPINDWDGKQKAVALAAAYMDDVRLIDNLLLN